MKRQFFSGNTLEQAVMLAARHFGIEPNRVAYSLREKKHGFVKIRRRVVIEVDSEAPELSPEEMTAPERTVVPEKTVPEKTVPEKTVPEKTVEPISEEKVSAFEPEPEPEPERVRRRPGKRRELRESPSSDQETPPRFDGTSLSESAAVELAVRELLRSMSVEGDVDLDRTEELFEIEITNTDPDALLDHEGRVLQAMEYLVPRIVRSWRGQGVPVKMDCDGFRAEREEELRELAFEVADEVREDGVSQVLEPMSPADRRLVHLALADDPDVFTESEGEGYYKRVRIFPGDELEDEDELEDAFEDEDELEEDELAARQSA